MQRKATVAIERIDPRTPEIAALIHALDRYMGGLYPTESIHLVDVETLAGPEVQFFAAKLDGKYCGCGAIMIRDEAYAEVKRIFVAPEARGHGIGRRILERLANATQDAGLDLMRLETGTLQPEALRLFEAMGFTRRDPFGDYPVDDPFSVFMERKI
jgi:putative acetyltransferase